nr:MAG TPA: hypothetical protein [Herelleviridae sp.]
MSKLRCFFVVYKVCDIIRPLRSPLFRLVSHFDSVMVKYSTIALKRNTSDFKGIVGHLDICDFQTTFRRTGDITTLVEHLCDFVREIQTTLKQLFSDFRLRPWKLFRLSKRLSKF